MSNDHVLTYMQEDILEILQEKGSLTCAQIADLLGVNNYVDHLIGLIGWGLVTISEDETVSLA